MSQRFVISDTHFNHSNVRFIPVRKEWEGAQGTIEEHDEALVDNWNSVVNKRDVVYILGDVGWDSHGYVTAGIIPRLNGRIEAVGGNHDTAEILQHFDKVHGVLIKQIKGRRCVMTHIPIHPQEMWWDYNIHGHLHGGTVKKYAHNKDMRMIGETDPRYINVCCEHMNYTPQPIEDLIPDNLYKL